MTSQHRKTNNFPHEIPYGNVFLGVHQNTSVVNLTHKLSCAPRGTDARSMRKFSIVPEMKHAATSSDQPQRDHYNCQHAHRDKCAPADPFQSHHRVSSSVVLRIAGAKSCEPSSAIPLRVPERLTGVFCKRRTFRTKLSKRLRHSTFVTSTASESGFETSHNSLGQKRPMRICLTLSASTAAHAAGGLPATTSRPPKHSASSFARL